MRKEATSLHTDGLRHFFFAGAQSRNVFNASGGFIRSPKKSPIGCCSLHYFTCRQLFPSAQLAQKTLPHTPRDWARPWPSTKSEFYTSCDPNVIVFFWCNCKENSNSHTEMSIKDLPASDVLKAIPIKKWPHSTFTLNVARFVVN